MLSIIPPNVQNSMHIDDVQVSCMAPNFSTAEIQAQLTIDRLPVCSDNNGFKYCAQKTVCVVFTGRQGTFAEPSLLLIENTLPVCDEQKFLG